MPLDTPPVRVKKAWRIPGNDASEAASIMSSPLQGADAAAIARFAVDLPVFEARQFAVLGMGEGDGLEHPAHAGDRLAGEPGQRTVDVGALAQGRRLLERLGAGFDAEPAQEF